jgi:hypothetical protein
MKNSMTGVRRLRTVSATVLSAGLLTAGALALGTGAAHAATTSSLRPASGVDTGSGYSVVYGRQAYWITASYNDLNVAVASGSGAPGASIIQWDNDGTSEQKWYFDTVYDGFGNKVGLEIQNENSGLCLTQDGTAGDYATQEPCDTESTQIFGQDTDAASNWFYNVSSGLYLDVSNYSYNEGDNIDCWYQNNQANQDFWVTATDS